MDNIKILPNPVSVYIANGEILKTNKLGILTARCQGHIVNIEALIVPKIKHNLISASKMTSKGHKIIVEKRKTIIKGHNFELKCENKSGLYILNLDSIIEKNENCHAIIDEQIWHKRLGHAIRSSFAINPKRATKIGELIHSDICGPITPCTIDGGRYFQVILDDYSHFVVVKVLKHKNEAESNLQDYIAELERQQNVKVKCFRLDNGGEFSSNNFQQFCRQNGIRLEYTMPYSPQMNGSK
ncbi:Integrase core domain [Popillia japonica]|uniref:Integrase core domain n=1 Tax=Popillia japonica TaxID=7064 RepID=A0AAW1ISH3_POPJA